jgi:hypothetical protein
LIDTTAQKGWDARLKKYRIENTELDSVELKCLVVSRGLKVDREVYRRFSETNRLDINPLACDCFILSDGTVVQLTDMSFHLEYLSGVLSWNNLKLLRYASQLTAPFSIRIYDDKPALFHMEEYIDTISFTPYTDFYKLKTSSGRNVLGNAVIQGLDWVAFQCLWPCEYAAAGKPCQFCFSGADFATLAKKKRPLPDALPARDAAEIIGYAVGRAGVRNIQLTGGSTFDGKTEAKYITGYLKAIASGPASDNEIGELLLYITPPTDYSLADTYFSLGASRIACSLEIWDMALAREITPGKIEYATRERHLDFLSRIAGKYGPGKAFSNFIIGIEGIDTLMEGASELAQRGILPSASVWMPMGKPVRGSMKPPDVDYYRRVKEHFAELYVKYNLRPPVSRGLNVCIESDIMRYADEY